MMQNEYNLIPNIITMNSVIAAHTKAGDKNGAIKYIKIMKD
jgi:hypothetical protein